MFIVVLTIMDCGSVIKLFYGGLWIICNDKQLWFPGMYGDRLGRMYIMISSAFR